FNILPCQIGITELYLKSRVPEFVKERRFANWIINARDWNISRNRYWGTPIPLWVSDDYEEIICVGSLAELEELSGCNKLTDIHRDKIDNITIPSKKGRGVLKRVEEVFDCWFESGSMPYAQCHYPFENKEKFEASFPADFIAEGLDQTRGWFYTLMVLSTHLFNKPAFKNLITNGLVLASDGKKMSKRLKNYPEPRIIINAYGADALRLYLVNSPVVRAEPLRFKEEGVKEVISKVFLPWYNAYRFLDSQVVLLKKNTDIEFKYNPLAKKSENVMDRWILACTQSLIKFVREEMEAYRLYTVVPRLLNLIEQLTNGYVRFNRKRLKGENGPEDTIDALNTLFEVLLTLSRVLASFTPFLTEHIYQNLKKYLPPSDSNEDTRSVHFLSFPEVRNEYFDSEIERRMSRMQAVIDLGRVIREKKNIGLKTPLKELVVIHSNSQYLSDVMSLENYIVEELNIKNLLATSDESKYGIKYRAEADWKVLGQKLKKDAVKVKNALPKLTSEQVKDFVYNKEILIDGIKVIEEDLQIIRYFEDANSHYETSTDKDVLILLDVRVYNDLQEEGWAREIVNRVQRLRKKAGLQPTDPVLTYYRFIEDIDNQIETVLKTQSDIIIKTLKRPLLPITEKIDGAEVIIEEVQDKMPSQEHNLAGERQAATCNIPDLNNLVPDSVSNDKKDAEFPESKITTEDKNDNVIQKDTPINNHYNKTRDTNAQNIEPMDWTPTKSDGSLPSPVRSRSRSGSDSESPSSNKSVTVNLIPLTDSISFASKHLIFAPDQEMKVGRVSGSRNQKEAKAENGVFICDVMSREHAILKEENGKILIKDTKSTHGTFVNNIRLGDGTQDSEWRELDHGDIITFGHSVRRNQNLYKHLSACVFYPKGKRDLPNIPISLNGNSAIGHAIDAEKPQSDKFESQALSATMTNIAQIQDPSLESSARSTTSNNKEEKTAEIQSNNIAQKASDDQVASANDTSASDHGKNVYTESKSREIEKPESPNEVNRADEPVITTPANLAPTNSSSNVSMNQMKHISAVKLEKRTVTDITNKTEAHPLKEEIISSDDFRKTDDTKPVTPAITPDPSPIEAPADDPDNKSSASSVLIKEQITSQALVEIKPRIPCMDINEKEYSASNGEGPSYYKDATIINIPPRKRKFEDVDDYNLYNLHQVEMLKKRIAELESRANKRRRWELIASTVVGMAAGVVGLG
ncbi:10793_t:CDS:10, partial [Scutellospora calospora]